REAGIRGAWSEHERRSVPPLRSESQARLADPAVRVREVRVAGRHFIVGRAGVYTAEIVRNLLRPDPSITLGIIDRKRRALDRARVAIGDVAGYLRISTRTARDNAKNVRVERDSALRQQIVQGRLQGVDKAVIVPRQIKRRRLHRL